MVARKKRVNQGYKANFAIDKELYQLFKFGCVLNGSNASTELRKLILEYTKKCDFKNTFDMSIFENGDIFDDEE